MNPSTDAKRIARVVCSPAAPLTSGQLGGSRRRSQNPRAHGVGPGAHSQPKPSAGQPQSASPCLRRDDRVLLHDSRIWNKRSAAECNQSWLLQQMLRAGDEIMHVPASRICRMERMELVVQTLSSSQRSPALRALAALAPQGPLPHKSRHNFIIKTRRAEDSCPIYQEAPPRCRPSGEPHALAANKLHHHHRHLHESKHRCKTHCASRLFASCSSDLGTTWWQPAPLAEPTGPRCWPWCALTTQALGRPAAVCFSTP